MSNGTSITAAEFLHLPYGTVRKVRISGGSTTDTATDTDLSRIYLRAKSSGSTVSIPANVEFYNGLTGTTGNILRVYSDPNDGSYYFEINVGDWLMASVEKYMIMLLLLKTDVQGLHLFLMKYIISLFILLINMVM